jgi:hypothetical protein
MSCCFADWVALLDTFTDSWSHLPASDLITGICMAGNGVRKHVGALSRGASSRHVHTHAHAHTVGFCLVLRKQGVRHADVLAAVQLRLDPSFSKAGMSDDPAAWLRSHGSALLAYEPRLSGKAGQGDFSASLEMREGDLILSFFQHLAFSRWTERHLQHALHIGLAAHTMPYAAIHSLQLAAERDAPILLCMMQEGRESDGVRGCDGHHQLH